MQAIELVKPGTMDPNPEATDAVMKHCHQNGVMVLNAGTYNNVLRFLPPLAISDELLHDALDVLAAGLAKLKLTAGKPEEESKVIHELSASREVGSAVCRGN